VQPLGSDYGDAPVLHAGAIFDSLDGFRQAVRQEEKHLKCKVFVHKHSFNETNGAFICRETNRAIQREGIAPAEDNAGARDRQWWRHVCAGACGYVAQVQRASDRNCKITALSKAMREHIKNNPRAAAPYEVGLNDVLQGQWVVTLYVPHTCVAAASASATSASNM
jgi:hypothetical protein